MKLIIIPNMEEVILEVPTTNKDTKEILLPKDNIHYWYPFNVNFSYKFTDSKNYLYLVKDKNYEGDNIYNVDILKRTKALPKRHGIMFNESVFNRNMYIMHKAMNIGITTLLDEFTLQDVERSFKRLGEVLNIVKGSLEKKYTKEIGESFHMQSVPTEEWDQAVYSLTSEKDEEVLIEIGEMYAMLNVMRKFVEER